MESIKAADLAEKIARLIVSESKPGDLSSIQKSLDQINIRLEKLESNGSIAHSTIWSSNSIHPSQDRFAIAEAIVDSHFERDTKEKACQLEPDKPCDHCLMCSSRGF